MTEAKLLLSKIKSSRLMESSSVLKEIKGGTKIQIDMPPSRARECMLTETYEIRLKNISQLKGQHALRLTKSTSEFLNNLILEDPEFLKTARVQVKPVGSFLVWFIPETYQVLGCLFTIGQNEVTSDTWKELWDGNEI